MVLAGFWQVCFLIFRKLSYFLFTSVWFSRKHHSTNKCWLPTLETSWTKQPFKFFILWHLLAGCAIRSQTEGGPHRDPEQRDGWPGITWHARGQGGHGFEESTARAGIQAPGPGGGAGWPGRADPAAGAGKSLFSPMYRNLCCLSLNSWSHSQELVLFLNETIVNTGNNFQDQEEELDDQAGQIQQLEQVRASLVPCSRICVVYLFTLNPIANN